MHYLRRLGAGSWCSAVIMVPLLNKAPILATGRLHGPLKFVAFAPGLLSDVWGFVGTSKGVVCRGAAQVRAQVAPDLREGTQQLQTLHGSNIYMYFRGS